MTTVNEARLRLINTAQKGVLNVTGGGTGIISELLRYGGGSKVLLDARVPYGIPAWKECTGRVPDKAVSADAARMLALAALTTARKLDPNATWGMGLSAALGYPDQREGRKNHLFACIAQANRYTTKEVTFDADIERMQQEELTIFHGLKLLADAVTSTPEGEIYEVPAPLDAIYNPNGNPGAVLLDGENAIKTLEIQQRCGLLIFPGSFNPAHHGHLEMARIAQEVTKKPVHFEVTIRNADKGGVDPVDLAQRADKLRQAKFNKLIATNLTLLADKARYFPGSTFVLGSDTWERVWDPKYYGGLSGMASMAATLRDTRTEFLVFGRRQNGNHIQPETELAAEHRIPVHIVPEDHFSIEAASSQIRKQFK